MDWGQIFSFAIESALGTQAMYFALAAIGLNIHFGYTGLLNFGQAGFMICGAYGLAISIVEYDLHWLIGIVVGLIASGIFALLLGIPTLRLRADYLAIVTIAAAEILRIVVRATSLRGFTGGSNGINGFTAGFQDARPGFLDGGIDLGFISFSSRQSWVLFLGWITVLLGVGFTYLLIHSPWGRVLKAVREDEDAARALGKNAYSVKMQSLVLGGLFGALGGIFFVLAQGSVQPTPQDFGTPKTFFIWVAMILGGTGKLWGPVIGSVIFSGLLAFTDSALRQAVAADYVPKSIIDGVQVGQMRFILLGLGLMVLMIYRPQGIFGDKRELALDAN